MYFNNYCRVFDVSYIFIVDFVFFVLDDGNVCIWKLDVFKKFGFVLIKEC